MSKSEDKTASAAAAAARLSNLTQEYEQIMSSQAESRDNADSSSSELDQSEKYAKFASLLRDNLKVELEKNELLHWEKKMLLSSQERMKEMIANANEFLTEINQMVDQVDQEEEQEEVQGKAEANEETDNSILKQATSRVCLCNQIRSHFHCSIDDCFQCLQRGSPKMWNQKPHPWEYKQIWHLSHAPMPKFALPGLQHNNFVEGQFFIKGEHSREHGV